MVGITMIDAADVHTTDVYDRLGREVAGVVTSRMLSPPGFPLWLAEGVLADSARLAWPEVHGDEVVYVHSGSLAIDGRTCPPGGAVVVESGVATSVEAKGPTRIAHAGPVDAAPPTTGLNGAADPEGHGVHVVGPRGTYAAVTAERDTHYYADSTCTTCRITLLYTSRTVPYVSPTHSHSVDELIYVLSGELWFGRRRLGPGSTVAIAADRRYGFRSGPEGFAFLNYRADASQQTVERGSPPVMEGGRVHGLEPVMDLL
ncbi:MAG: cupin domain-containing protein [Acidimicrobiales bacterium]